mgnify:CR=1 FL=1
MTMPTFGTTDTCFKTINFTKTILEAHARHTTPTTPQLHAVRAACLRMVVKPGAESLTTVVYTRVNRGMQ